MLYNTLDSSACSHRSKHHNGEADACIEARPQLFDYATIIFRVLGTRTRCHDLHRLSWNEARSQRLISYVALDLSLPRPKDYCISQRLLFAYGPCTCQLSRQGAQRRCMPQLLMFRHIVEAPRSSPMELSPNRDASRYSSICSTISLDIYMFMQRKPDRISTQYTY